MCYAVLKLKYISAAEPSQFLEVENEHDLPPKMDELKARPGVQSITIFPRGATHRLVTEWRVGDE